MIKLCIASLKLAITLVCVGVSLILGAHWIGLVPNDAEIRSDGRRHFCETVAINSAAHIRKQQWLDLEATLQTIVDRHEGLLSIGVRSDLGPLRIDTGHHAEMWEREESDGSEVHAMHVPVTLNRRDWGDVEFCFRGGQASFLGRLMDHPMTRLTCFFIVAGLFSYSLLMARVMGVFSTTQVVPDRVRQALDTLAEGLLVLDERERIVLANRAFAETLCLDAGELVDTRADALHWLSDSADPTPEYPWSCSIHDAETRLGNMLRYRLADGSERVFSVNAAPIGGEGEPRGALVTFRDVTHVEAHRAELEKMLSMLRSSRDEVRRKNRELEILATQDALTGCLNRRAFFERFETLWNEAKKQDMPLACLMIDNDHFKSVNDTYGHHIGDEVLRRVARVIRDLHQDNRLVCRYGGEEFCVVLPKCDLDAAVMEAEKTREAIGEIWLEEVPELRLSASLGVSELCFDAPTPQELIIQADACLYVAKRGGRNQVVAYQPGFEELDPAEEAESDKAEEESHVADIPFQAVTALVSALAYRDADTAEHSRRVADLCVQAAAGLLDQRQTYLLEIAGLLHDIGKIGVPDHILLNPGKLTEEQWQLMRRHDRIGVEIIAGTFNCPELSEIIRTHHAFFDGSKGDHLPRGTAIPLLARLLTIADSYDAMVSDRVYRPGRTRQEAIAELRRCAGTQFDPELVEHFVGIVSEMRPSRDVDAPAVPKRTALQIGLQIERLADAIDGQDTQSLKTLASRLGLVARRYQIAPIIDAAAEIEKHADAEETQWMVLLRQTQHLMELCRATQNAYLKDSAEENGAGRLAPVSESLR